MKTCIGCGVCEYVCNRDAIEITWENGEYKAHIKNENCINCGLCKRVCPFETDNYMDLNRSNMLGNVIGCYVGAVGRLREKATSGGALTELCTYLLDKNLVDSVLCVGVENNDKWFQYKEVSNADDLVKCARSAYYPVSLKSVKEIIKISDNKRYAVVGLPCVCTSLRKLRELKKEYIKRIPYIFGIVCSYTPNAEMITHIVKNVGVQAKDISSIAFRDKSLGDLYGLSIVFKNGEVKKYLPDEWGLRRTFLNKEYIREGCLVCNDVYAVSADAVFMDAWKKGEEDKLGKSLVITRNKEIDECIRSMNWEYKKADVSRAIEAQDYGHLIDFKIFGSRYRRSKLGYTSNCKDVSFKNKIESLRLLKANKILLDHLEKKTSFEQYRRKVLIGTGIFILIRKICSVWDMICRRIVK